MRPTALFPLRRKSCYGYLSPSKIHNPRPDLNPWTLRPIASMVIIRPPRTTIVLLPSPSMWRHPLAQLGWTQFRGWMNYLMCTSRNLESSIRGRKSHRTLMESLSNKWVLIATRALGAQYEQFTTKLAVTWRKTVCYVISLQLQWQLRKY
jgi:hypothetical protein